MKFSENWLRTVANPPLSTRELADALTFAGLEVEGIEAAAAPFERVVVGEVLSVDKHPGADRLSVCRVNVGVAPLTIVCGAPNVRVGMKVPTALMGARLPGMEIRATAMRGVESHGMLCSEKELGLSAESSGIMALAPDARVGADVRVVLDLEDSIFTTKPTPNRGDCLSILGVAREVAAVTGARIEAPRGGRIDTPIADALPVVLEAPEACPRYCGRLVRGVDAAVATPKWMATRLTRSGLRSISAIVDITNYVMLELGQPLHAFDAGKLEGGIRVRYARSGESIALLNGETLTLKPGYLVIADEAKPVALAGIMGGEPTSVGPATRDIFLESAYFTPETIAGKSRELGFGSDSSFRFERGVDFKECQRALDRVTQLVLEICGGRAGPTSEVRGPLPERQPVQLRLGRAERMLGVKFDRQQTADILRRLGFAYAASERGFTVTPPSYRFDIAIEEDLVEELARIHGFDRIPAAAPIAPAGVLPAPEATRTRSALRARLAARDYHEVVTYSFIDRRWEEDLCGNAQPLALANPIASHMNVMRSSLMPGLVMSVAHNVRHRQDRVRLFEIGRCFVRASDDEAAQPVRAGIAAYGGAVETQWGEPSRRVDFYDVKGDLEALFAPRAVKVEAAEHPALHPGKSGRVIADGAPVGWIGELHPRWQQKYELPSPVVLLELDYEPLAVSALPAYREIPKVPPVRRDMSAELDEGVPAEAIVKVLLEEAPPIVADVRVFDVYRGKDLPKGRKSLAFMVLLQDTRKTLTDAEVESAVSRLRETLQKRFDAKLR